MYDGLEVDVPEEEGEENEESDLVDGWGGLSGGHYKIILCTDYRLQTANQPL
jgi:hypothetical protein